LIPVITGTLLNLVTLNKRAFRQLTFINDKFIINDLLLIPVEGHTVANYVAYWFPEDDNSRALNQPGYIIQL
jgi:hypothetical protein